MHACILIRPPFVHVQRYTCTHESVHVGSGARVTRPACLFVHRIGTFLGTLKGVIYAA